jgi:hypothetical protein
LIPPEAPQTPWKRFSGAYQTFFPLPPVCPLSGHFTASASHSDMRFPSAKAKVLPAGGIFAPVVPRGDSLRKALLKACKKTMHDGIASIFYRPCRPAILGIFLLQERTSQCRMSKDFFRLPDQRLIRKDKRPREPNFSRLLSRAPLTIRMQRSAHREWIRDSSTPCAPCATQDRVPHSS